MAGGPQLPNESSGSTQPAEVPLAAAVDVHHRGRYLADGNIRATVAGSRIDLGVQLPWPAGTAAGVLGDDLVTLTWNLQTSESDLPHTLHGTVGTEPVNLEGVFQLRPDFLRGISAGRSFTGGSIQGTLVGSHLAATVGPTTGAIGGTRAIVATGTLGDHHFEILAALTGRPLRGDVAAIGYLQGTYDGQTVHLDLTSAEQFGDTDVTGTCPAPPTFSTLLIAALLFFA